MRLPFHCICQVFSWDTTTNSPDEDETDGRSYISAISEVVTDPDETCSGMAQNTMGEARMDIESSEIGYLGFQDSESYGLTWKVGQVGSLLDRLRVDELSLHVLCTKTRGSTKFEGEPIVLDS